jgi:hypothetical protein
MCRFGASDVEDPFKRWFGSTEVTCVSDTATLPAATIAVSFREGQRGVLYVPRDATAIPLSPTGRTLVPANEPFWLFVVEKSSPVGILDVPPIDAGTERTIDARADAPSAVVTWLQIPESDRAAVNDARGLSPPRIYAGGRESDRVTPLNGAFVRIRSAADGDTEIELSGRGWLPQRHRIKVKQPLTAITQPLVARPSAALLINWNGSPSVPALEAAIGTCDRKYERPHYEVAIERCSTPQRPIDPLTCTAFRDEVIPPDTHFGSFALDDLVPGTYRVQITFGKLPPVTAVVNAPGARQTTLHLRVAFVALSGALTIGGEPAPGDSVLRFPGGIGFSAGKSGEYQAAVPDRIPLLSADAQIEIAACDGGSKAIDLVDRPLFRSSTYDIDIPDNELEISVTDTFTHEPIVATLKYELMSIVSPFRAALTGSMEASAPPGSARMRFVPLRKMRVSVTAPGYQKQDLAPFTLDKSERKRIDVQLMPVRGDSGKVTSSVPFDSAMVFWFNKAGEETEHADVGADGTFIYSGSHDGSETMAVVSRSHPLWVLRSPAVERGEPLQLRFPDGRARTFEITFPAGPARFVAVIVGGIRIPMPVFRQHQDLVRLPWTSQPNGTLTVRELVDTGPIDVVLGPRVDEVARGAMSMDLFAFPQFANGARVRLPPDANSVSFNVAR